jgi:hypothetical protein
VFLCSLEVNLGLSGQVESTYFATALAAFGFAGLLLYPLAIRWGPIDPHSLGWHSWAVFVSGGVVTPALILCTNRLGVVLVLAIAAWHWRAVASVNYWDYLVDPFYFSISAGALDSWTWRARSEGSRGASLLQRWSADGATEVTRVTKVWAKMRVAGRVAETLTQTLLPRHAKCIDDAFEQLRQPAACACVPRMRRFSLRTAALACRQVLFTDEHQV